MSFLCKMRRVIVCRKSSLFGHIPPQPRFLTSQTALFFSVCLFWWFKESLASWNQTSCKERQHLRRSSREQLSRDACLWQVAGTCPLGGIIFGCGLCRTKSAVDQVDLRNALFDSLVPKHLWSTTWTSPFIQGLAFEFLACFHPRPITEFNSPKTGSQGADLPCLSQQSKQVCLFISWKYLTPENSWILDLVIPINRCFPNRGKRREREKEWGKRKRTRWLLQTSHHPSFYLQLSGSICSSR